MLDNNNSDEAKGASGNVDTGRIKRDTSLHNTFATSELALAPTESTNASGPWYDVEEGRYTEEPAPGLRSSEPQACLLLPHKPNPRPSPNYSSHCKIRPTSKLSAVSLEAHGWSLRSTPSLSLPIAAMIDRQMRTWLN
jgi:hypothetical protein